MGRLTERVINQVKKTKSHKKKKQTMKKKLFKTRLLSFAAFCGLTLAFASCANEDVAQNPNNTDNDKNLTTFTAGDPSTRTSMESDGKFFWEAGDKIWVKDDNGTWKQSSNTPTTKTASFMFKVPGKAAMTVSGSSMASVAGLAKNLRPGDICYVYNINASASGIGNQGLKKIPAIVINVQ